MAEGSMMAWSSGELLASNSWRNSRLGSTKLAPAHATTYLIKTRPSLLAAPFQRTFSPCLSSVHVNGSHPCSL